MSAGCCSEAGAGFGAVYDREMRRLCNKVGEEVPVPPAAGFKHTEWFV